jgi:PAS domain S-box-containing protein
MELARGAHRLLSVRARLIAFALLCAVPVLVLTALQLYHDDQRLQAQAADQARVLAERLETRLGVVLAASESVGHAIGALTLGGSLEGPACSVALARARAAAGPLALNYTLSGPDGRLWCSAAALGTTTSVADRPHFRAAVQTRQPAFSNMTMGKMLVQPMVLLSVPIIGADGDVRGVATQALDGPGFTRGLFSRQEGDATVAVFDRQGVLVSRWPEHPVVTPGKDYAGSALFRHATARVAVPTRVPGVDGVARQYVTRAVVYRGEPVLWIAAGIDVQSLEALTRASRAKELALVAMVVLGVMAVAALITRPLVLGRLHGLIEVAGRVARGEYDRRVALRVKDDLTPVEEALNHMLEAVQADRFVLAASERRYRMLFEYSLDGVLQTTVNGVILAANPAACRLLGRTEAELRTLRRSDLLDLRDPRLETFLRQRNQSHQGQARAELALLRGDAERIEVEIASSRYQDEDGQELTCIVIRDVTERNATREQVLRLNRELEARVARRTQELQAANRELEAFSYSVSHDLRAPVAVIRSFAEVLDEQDAVQGEKHRHYLRRIRAAGKLMSGLIDGLLALAHISRTRIEWSVVDLSALAVEAVQQLSDEQPQQAVQVDIAPGLHAVGDARLLRVVIHNLVANAWKFSAASPQPHVRVSCAQGAEGVTVFQIQDNGCGFEPQQAHRLFSPFQRLHASTEFPGLGIGLATVHRIVQRHGGRIWAEGRPGQGATFYFELGTQDEARAISASPVPGVAEEPRSAPV